MHDVLGVRPDPAQDAKHGLDEKRRLDEATLKEVIEVIEMPGVVALELEARSGAAERAQHEFDVLERIAEHEIARVLERLRLPIMFKGLEAVEHREQPEVHRAHI